MPKIKNYEMKEDSIVIYFDDGNKITRNIIKLNKSIIEDNLNKIMKLNCDYNTKKDSIITTGISIVMFISIIAILTTLNYTTTLLLIRYISSLSILSIGTIFFIVSEIKMLKDKKNLAKNLNDMNNNLIEILNEEKNKELAKENITTTIKPINHHFDLSIKPIKKIKH